MELTRTENEPPFNGQQVGRQLMLRPVTAYAEHSQTGRLASKQAAQAGGRLAISAAAHLSRHGCGKGAGQQAQLGLAG